MSDTETPKNVADSLVSAANIELYAHLVVVVLVVVTVAVLDVFKAIVPGTAGTILSLALGFATGKSTTRVAGGRYTDPGEGTG